MTWLATKIVIFTEHKRFVNIGTDLEATISPGRLLFHQGGYYFTREATISPGRLLFHQGGYYFTREATISPGRLLFHQGGYYFTREATISPGRLLFHQGDYYFTRETTISPGRLLFHQGGYYFTREATISPGRLLFHQGGYKNMLREGVGQLPMNWTCFLKFHNKLSIHLYRGVISIFPNAIQFIRVHPWLGQILLWSRQREAYKLFTSQSCTP